MLEDLFIVTTYIKNYYVSIMNLFLKRRNKLGSVQINENEIILTWRRLKYTFRIANYQTKRE